MTGDPQPPIEGPSRAIALVVPSDVVPKQIVSEQYVATMSSDLGGFAEVNVGISAGRGERVWAVLRKV